MPLLQGYGLTEAAPIVSGNLIEDNIPDSVGVPLPGVEIKLAGQDELLVRGPGAMLGYWNRPQDTRDAIDADGWLHTGDQARILGHHLYIAGRLKNSWGCPPGKKSRRGRRALRARNRGTVRQASRPGVKAAKHAASHQCHLRLCITSGDIRNRQGLTRLHVRHFYNGTLRALLWTSHPRGEQYNLLIQKEVIPIPPLAGMENALLPSVVLVASASVVLIVV